MFPYAVLNHHACVLHGVVMEYEGKGILVTAPAGTGKTTHTRMWRDWKHALILNGDRASAGSWRAFGMPTECPGRGLPENPSTAEFQSLVLSI